MVRSQPNASLKPSSDGESAKSAHGPLRKQLRALDRLLMRSSLPEGVRQTKERERAELQARVSQHSRQQRERHFSKKYHGVRFIERRKIERRISSIQRELANAEDSTTSSLRAELLEAERDLLYVRHFPRSKKYLALFPGSNGNDAYVVKRRNQIRARIVRRVEAGLPVGRSQSEDDDEEMPLYDSVPELEGDEFFDGPAVSGYRDSAHADHSSQPPNISIHKEKQKRRRNSDKPASVRGKRK